MFDHLLESSHRDDSNKWSNIGFSQEIKERLLKFMLRILSGALTVGQMQKQRQTNPSIICCLLSGEAIRDTYEEKKLAQRQKLKPLTQKNNISRRVREKQCKNGKTTL